MTADESNLLCYLAIQVVKIMARDLGKRAMKATFGGRAFASRDTKHLQKLCQYIWKVDQKMGELAIKVVLQNGPKAQEQELLRAVRSTLGPDFFDRKYEHTGTVAKDAHYEAVVTQEDESGKGEEERETRGEPAGELGEATEA